MHESTIENKNLSKASDKAGLLTKLARKAVFSTLSKIQHGRITLQEGNETYIFGRATDICSLKVSLEITSSTAYGDIAFNGSIGAGESYMKGYWRCNDLTALVRIFVLNREVLQGMEKGFARLSLPIRKLFQWAHKNSKAGSRKNIRAHYDLGNDFFRLFLDGTMMYSSAIFPNSNSSLYQASLYKLDMVCQKLQLQPGDHLLEIGTGWGGLAIHAAKHYGCKITTTTISKEQYKLAKERIKAAGLEQHITVLLQDYRDLQGQFDKIVSIEMIEAVGHEHFKTYFQSCSKLLKSDGMMLIQAITIADQYYEYAKRSIDFIQRYIFPGGSLPSIKVISETACNATDLRIGHMEDFGEHYALTLAKWRHNFFSEIEKIRALGYPEEFIRMWEYYLCYCEGGFLERSIGVAQVLLHKPMNRQQPLLLNVEAAA